MGIWACHFPEEDCFWELKNWSNAGCRTVSRRVKDPGGRCNWSLPSPSTSEEAQRFCYVGIYWLGPWFWFDAHHVKMRKMQVFDIESLLRFETRRFAHLKASPFAYRSWPQLWIPTSSLWRNSAVNAPVEHKSSTWRSPSVKLCTCLFPAWNHFSYTLEWPWQAGRDMELNVKSLSLLKNSAPIPPDLL